ncbi:bile acid:sodium symporter family protein [Motiliproteus sp.]|uniref:bile acid:sodium symporter family protein n=1 Tax=Motiliproteus sp. TaxID=1898955 RepID=UPI003BAA6291
MMLSQILLPAALFCLMLGLGLGLTVADFRRLLERPRLLLAGLVGQLLLLPLLVFALLQLWSLPTELAVGLMIVALAPGGATSNLISHLCRGDLALSVSLTGLSSLIVPLSLPLGTAVALEFWQAGTLDQPFPVLPTMLKLVLMALLPVVLGMLLRRRFSAFALWIQPLVKALALVFMLAVIGLISWSNWDRLESYLGLLAPLILLIATLAMLLGYRLAKLVDADAAAGRTLAIEVGIQNAGTALLVTGAVLQQPQMSAAVLLYGILMQIPALLLIIASNLPGLSRAQTSAR